MKRKEYNRSVLKKCIELLQSRDPNETFEGVVLSAYLIEQSFKAKLRKINPFLYFDKKNISDEMEACIALNKIPQNEIIRLKTATAKKCITQMCEYKDEFKPHRANIEELFNIRNYILHSTDDLSISNNLAAETAVSALRICKKCVVAHCGISLNEFNPLTSREFEKLQEKQRNERNDGLKTELKEHKKIFEALSKPEILERASIEGQRIDDYTWIEETVECPACNQLSLNKIGFVDFDWNPDGIISNGGYHYECRICELNLSEYEYELVSDFKL